MKYLVGPQKASIGYCFCNQKGNDSCGSYCDQNCKTRIVVK
ncbi:MAG: Clo7bot family Cys-rich peptide [Clostridia bacterium]|nr:Clo7bot family Cys-rich peptide [Clostridia bacterium]